MFNERPSSLFELKPKQVCEQTHKLFSPILSTPDEFSRYYEHLIAADRISGGVSPLVDIPTQLLDSGAFDAYNKPNELDPSIIARKDHDNPLKEENPDPLEAKPEPQLDTQELVQPQQDSQLHQQEAKMEKPTHQPQPQPQQHLLQQHPPQLHQHHAPPQQLDHISQPQLQPLHQILSIPHPQNTTQTQLVYTQEPVWFLDPNFSHLKQVDAVPPKSTTGTKSKLTEEEKIKNKRERNRRAAANCRRRKDEKLKKLEMENEELRRTIEILQSNLAMLQAQFMNQEQQQQQQQLQHQPQEQQQDVLVFNNI